MNLGFDCTLLPAVCGAETFSPFVCQLCNRFYQRPLLLPCSHSFCEKCVYDAAFRNYNKFVCRRCQTICDITKDQVRYNRDLTNALRLVGPINTSHLWVDFKIRCMSHGDTKPEASRSSGLLKKWFCLPCSSLVCQKCKSSGGDHADHKTVPAISHVDFDAIYMEALKAAFAYNVVQQTSDELFWLLEDLKTATAKLQDYCESYYTYVDEHVSLTQGCLETLAVALKKQVCRQAVEKRRRLHWCTKLATELMDEARRREAQGNILLEPLDPIRSAKAYNEAQKWLLYWVTSPPSRIQLPHEYPIPNPIGTKQSQSTTGSERKKMEHNTKVMQPPKTNVEVLVDTCASKFQKRVSPIGSNRPSFRGSSCNEEKVELNNKTAVNSATRELLTGIQLPLHQQLTAPIRSSNGPAADSQSPTDSLITKENESNSHLQTSHLVFGNSWPSSKADFDRCSNVVNQSGRNGSNDNDIVIADVKTLTTSIHLSPIGTKRPSSRNKIVNERLEMTNKGELLTQLDKRNNGEKREVLVGIQLPIHENIAHLSGREQIFLASKTGSEAQTTPLTKSTNYPPKILSCSTKNNCVPSPDVNSLGTKTKPHEDKLHKKHLAGGIIEDQCGLPGINPLPINLISESSIGLSSYQSTAKQEPSSIDGKDILTQQRGGKADAIDLVNEKKLKTQSKSCSADGSNKRNQSSQLGVTTDVHYIPHSTRESTRMHSKETNAELCNASSIEDIRDKNIRTFILNINDNENNSLITAIKDETNGSTKINLHITGEVKLLVDDQCNCKNHKSPDKKQEENSTLSNNVMVDIAERDKVHDGNAKNEMAHTYQEVHQQAYAKDTDEAPTYEQINILGGEHGLIHQGIMRYNRDELLKIREHAHLKDNKFGGSEIFEWHKIPDTLRKKTRVSIDNVRSHVPAYADTNGMPYNDEMNQSSYFKDCIGKKDLFRRHITSETVDAEKILEGLECSFVRMAWDTVESILLELTFVHSDVNWAELWHLLVTAARPDAEFRLHPSDGAHCVTTRAVHLLHIAPLLDLRRVWANWGRTHPCHFHQDRLSKYYGIPSFSGNVVSHSSSLFQTHDKNDFSMHTSRNVEINIIKPETISGTTSILQGKSFVFPEQKLECGQTDYSSLLKSRAFKKMPTEAHPMQTWAELVSGAPGVHTSKNVEVNIIKPEAISGMTSILPGKPCIFPEQKTECAQTDYNSLLQSRALKKLSAETHTVKTWAELVSSAPRVNTSKNAEVNIIKPDATSGTTSCLYEKSCIFPEQKPECAQTDYSSLLKSGAFKEMSAEAHPAKTWAELVSGAPRVHCCQQSHTESIQQQNRPFTYSPSASLTFHPFETIEGLCRGNYTSRNIVDELLQELATPEHEHKSKPNAFLQEPHLSDANLTPEQYRMHCLLNNERVDLGPCTNPNCPNLTHHDIDYSGTPTAMKQTGSNWCRSSVHGRLQQQLLNGTNFSSMPVWTWEPPLSGFQTSSANVISDISLNKNKMLNKRNRNKCSQSHNSTYFGRTNLITKTIDDAMCQNNIDYRVPKLPLTSCAGESDSENTSHSEKQLGSALISQNTYPGLQRLKNDAKSKNTLTLADWISLEHPKINNPIVTGGLVRRHHCRQFVSSDNQQKHQSVTENFHKGAMMQPVTWHSRSRGSKVLNDENKPRSRGSSADQTERVLQPKPHVSKAKIRKEQRKLRQNQKKPWSTAGRRSCDQRDQTDSNKEETGEKEELCTEESPDDKTPEDSEDADLSTESPPLYQGRHVKCKYQERSEQESDEEWSVSRSWHIKQGQVREDTSHDLIPEALKQDDDRRKFGRIIDGDPADPEVLPSCSTASVTPELLEFFRSRRKSRLGSSKSIRTDHRRVKKERQVKNASTGFGKQV